MSKKTLLTYRWCGVHVGFGDLPLPSARDVLGSGSAWVRTGNEHAILTSASENLSENLVLVKLGGFVNYLSPGRNFDDKHSGLTLDSKSAFSKGWFFTGDGVVVGVVRALPT